MGTWIRTRFAALLKKSVRLCVALLAASTMSLAVADELLLQGDQVQGVVNFVHADRFELVVDDRIYVLPEMFPVNGRVQTVRQVLQELKPGQVVRFTITQMPDGRSQVVEMSTSVGQ